MTVYDWRDKQQPGGPDPKCGRIVRGKLEIRAPTQIDSIALHQTGCWLGVSTMQRLSAGGDEALARRRRAMRIHAHATTLRDGSTVVAYPLRAYVWHGNGANERSIGLEVEGLYTGHAGGSNDEPTQAVVDGARAALAWLVDAAKAEGVTIRHVLAHRQYSASRRADPGWSLWQGVALWAETALGLTTLPDVTDRDGKPIPKAWDARQVEPY